MKRAPRKRLSCQCGGYLGVDQTGEADGNVLPRKRICEDCGEEYRSFEIVESRSSTPRNTNVAFPPIGDSMPLETADSGVECP